MKTMSRTTGWLIALMVLSGSAGAQAETPPEARQPGPATPPSAPAEPSGVAGPQAPAGPVQLVLPANLILHRIQGTLLLGISADQRLAVWDIRDPAHPVKMSEQALAGPAVDLKWVDGIAFAVLARTEVAAFRTEGGTLRPLTAQVDGGPRSDGATGPSPADGSDERPGSGSPSQVGSAPQAQLRLLGRVTRVSRGTVLLELDSPGTLRPGDAVLIRSQRKELRLNLMTGNEEQAVSNAPVAVVEVRQIQGTKAVAELARGDEANVGDTVERTDRPLRGGSIFAPRAGYTTWVRGIARPFPNFGEMDVGALLDLSMGWYWEWLHIQGRVAPLGLSAPQAVHAYNAQLVVSYQNDLAEFGVGGGYFSHEFEGNSSYDCTTSGYVATAKDAVRGGGASAVPVYNCAQTGPAVAQYLRLGAVDGLNLRVTNTLAISDGKFRFGYLEGSLDVPVSRVLNLYLAGGGSTGIKWGEGGMRTYLRGVGGSDTLILTTGVGGTSVRTTALFGGTSYEYDVGAGQQVQGWSDRESTVGGLHLAVGLEWRR